MTAFILKSGVSMILLFGLYRLLLSKEKLFVFNRYFLIVSVVFSFAAPFISIPVHPVYREQAKEILSMVYDIPFEKPATSGIDILQKEAPVSDVITEANSALPGKIKKIPIDTKQVLLVIYLAGFTVMLLRFCRNIFMVNRLFRLAEKIDKEWYRIALISHNINPFSFLRTVYLNKDDYISERIAPNVLRHELEHVKQFHSRDIIFFELIHMFFWFNPVLILYKRAARINHEYLADEAVISNMQDIKAYALELVNFIGRKVNVPVASGFSPSMIRLRLLMLNSSTSRGTKNSRVLVALAASSVLLTVLSFRPEFDTTQERKNKNLVTETDSIVIEEVFFRGTDFKPLKAQIVFNGRMLGPEDTLNVDPRKIKYIDILNDREATRRYGKNARDGVFEIGTYDDTKRKTTDSLYFKEIFTMNNRAPEGMISIPVSNLYSSSIYTYPIFPNQTSDKQWRTLEIMTRDYFKLRGKVIRENGEPLTGVYVTATDHPTGVRTDKDGRFLLEDVKPDAMAEISADGYEPLFFRVSGVVYTLDMKITLDAKNGENGKNNISASYIINDFTGSWKFNKGLSRTIRPEGYDMLYNIRQFDGDSIFMSITNTTPTHQEFKHNGSFVFNTVKSRVDNQFKHKISCSIDTDGKSFSVTREAKNIITSWENKSSEKYSLSKDGKQLFIRTIDYPDIDSMNGEEIELLVFDKK